MHAGVGATNSCHAKKEAVSHEPASFYFCASDTAAHLAAGSAQRSRKALT